MSGRISFDRRWSFFAPDYTYGVRDGGVWIGEVARMAGQRRWWASNKTWTDGGDLPQTFPTRADAADALYHIANLNNQETS